MECITCHRKEGEVELQKCPICFRLFCEEDAYNYSGRKFCSKHCADYFFFGDPED